DLAAIIVMALPLAIMSFWESQYRSIALFLTLLFGGLGLELIWWTKSRGALLGLIVMLTVFFIIKVQNIRYRVMGVMAILLISILAYNTVGSILQRSSSDLEESFQGRLNYIKAGLNMAVRNPIFGVGLGGFHRNFYQYSWDGTSGSKKGHTIHSTWFLILCENGFPAFILFMGILSISFKQAWRMRQAYPQYLLSLGAYATCMSFLSHSYTLYPFILMALIQSSYAVTNEQETTNFMISRAKYEVPYA
ncbi:MAG: O-antigen ligase family protein, partial [Pseudomonadota bacterium]